MSFFELIPEFLCSNNKCTFATAASRSREAAAEFIGFSCGGLFEVALGLSAWSISSSFRSVRSNSFEKRFNRIHSVFSRQIVLENVSDSSM